MVKVKKLANKSEIALDKHIESLRGTEFECCARCPRTSGRVENGKMTCAAAGPGPGPITPVHAARCDGSKPPTPYNLRKRK